MIFGRIGNPFLNRLLAVLMLARGSQSLYFILVQLGQVHYLQYLFKIFNLFYFAAPACSYLYFKGFVRGETKLKKWEWLHFLPLVYVVIDATYWYLLDSPIKHAALEEIRSNKSFFINGTLGIVSNQANLLLCTSLFVIYLLWSLRVLLKSGLIFWKSESRLVRNWLLFLYSFLFSIQLVRLIPFAARYLFGFNSPESHLNSLYINISSIILFGAIVFVFFNPRILYGFVLMSGDSNRSPELAAPSQDLQQAVPDEKGVQQPAKVKQAPALSVVKNEKEYREQIIAFMEDEMPYLNPDFSINSLAQKLNIPIHHCSYLVNYTIGKNFREWVNGYRVAHFIRVYPLHIKTKTIVTITIDCGFKNKNTFYSAFKNIMGSSPSQYFSDPDN